MAKIVKASGKTVNQSRRLSMHGIKAERSAMKNSAWLRKNAEKPHGSTKPGKGR